MNKAQANQNFFIPLTDLSAPAEAPSLRVNYLIGDKRFTVTEPGIVHIPAKTPHTFVNIGDKQVQIITFFPSSSYEINWEVLGPNPLLK